MRLVVLWSLIIVVICVVLLLAEKKILKKRSITVANMEEQRDDRIERRGKGNPDTRPYYIDPEFYFENVNTVIEQMDELLPETEEKSVKVLKPRLRRAGLASKIIRAFWALDSDKRSKDPELEELLGSLNKKTLEIRKQYVDDEVVREWFNQPLTNAPTDDMLDAARELKGEELEIFKSQLSDLDIKIFDKVGGLGKMVVLLLTGDCMVFTLERRDYIITYPCEGLED